MKFKVNRIGNKVSMDYGWGSQRVSPTRSSIPSRSWHTKCITLMFLTICERLTDVILIRSQCETNLLFTDAKGKRDYARKDGNRIESSTHGSLFATKFHRDECRKPGAVLK